MRLFIYMKDNKNFIWNLVYVGYVIKEYQNEHKDLIIEWNFPNGELDALCIIVGVEDAIAIEKRYLLYSDITDLQDYELKKKINSILDSMRKCI